MNLPSSATYFEQPSTDRPHICVCICTYRRPHLLQRLLRELRGQKTEGRFTYSIVIADNDGERSAEPAVNEARADYPVPIEYCVEPRQNIALARNKVVANARGEYLAFIDDDEFPIAEWLLRLFRALQDHKVDGVLGPVRRHFDQEPPSWLRKSHFYDRRVNPTGMQVEWREARTGNVLLSREVLAGDGDPFRPEFRAGEDQDFFRRKIEAGYRFIWCADAEAFESVPPARWKRRYLLQKGLLRGATAALQPTCGAASIAKSLIAIPVYTLAIPFVLLMGQHRLMEVLVSMSDHLGKLMMRAGINPVRGEYVAE